MGSVSTSVGIRCFLPSPTRSAKVFSRLCGLPALWGTPIILEAGCWWPFSSIALAGSEEHVWRKAAAGVASFLAAIAIVLSGTRSAMLGLAIGGLVFLFLRRPRKRTGAAAVALLSVAAGTVFFFSPAGTKLRARLHWAQEDPLGGARLLLWRDSLRMASHRSLAGFGPETFTTQFPLY